MALTEGYYWWPMQQLQVLMAATGTFAEIVSTNMVRGLAIPSTTRTTIYDQTTAGPGVIIWLPLDPTSTFYHRIWLTVDGTEIVTDERVHPSLTPGNYIVGKIWEGTDEHVCYNFNLVFFKTGFEIEAKRENASFPGTVNCYWYGLDWV